MTEIGAFEAKTKLSALLDRASKGETITITKRGKPVARLMPPEDSVQARHKRALAELAKLRATVEGTFTAEEIIEMRDVGKK